MLSKSVNGESPIRFKVEPRGFRIGENVEQKILIA